MRNIKLILEYDGTKYFGFQKQPKHPTIQAELERALSILLREKIKATGAARTDAGIHARGQVVNFFTSSSLSFYRMQYSLNAILPKDIKVVDLEKVASSFDARKSAVSKRYRYYILNRAYPSAFLEKYSYFISSPLNLKKMKEATEYFLGKHDFASFCAQPTLYKSRIRTISELNLRRMNRPALPAGRLEKGLICVEIKANGFLYNMARVIVGTLIEVGLGKVSPEEIKKIIASKDRKKAGPTAPAKALFLTDVYYK